MFRSRRAILGQVILWVECGLGFLQLPITSALLYAFRTVSFCSIPHVESCFDLLLYNPPSPPPFSIPISQILQSFTCSKTHSLPGLSDQLTSFDTDVGAADLARLVFGGAEVVVVVDVAVVGGGREGVQLQGAIGVHVADVGHVVDVVAGGQVPAQYGTGGAPCWTGQGHPHRAGVGYPLQGGIHKVQPGRAHILTVYCRGKTDNTTSLNRPRWR